jgi:prepilin-type N-terminal cleavage/methylation domain-containing protein
MTARSASLRFGSQGGYTAIEMIITMALTGILSGAIFSSFVVLERIQAAWQERDQARAVGVLAEQPLLRDVQAYKVFSVGSSSTTDKSPRQALVLRGVSTDGTPLEVSYSVAMRSGGAVLSRTVTPCLSSTCKSTVAHGVMRMAVSCVPGGGGTTPTLAVNMSLSAISVRSSRPVDVSPVLKLTPRNGNLQVCP